MIASNPVNATNQNQRRGHMQMIALIVCILAALILPCWVSSPVYQNLAILILMSAQVGVAWNIVGGYAGQISLGHAAFFGIGAYTSSLLVLHMGLNPWLAMLLAGAVSVLISLPIGASCFRLRGHYFTMATIAIAEIVQIIFNNWDFAGAAVGLSLPMDGDGWMHMVFSSKVPYYYIALGLLLATLATSWLINRSYIGYYLRAIKDEPEAARSLGIPLGRYKQFALAVSSFYTALGGSFYAQKELYIDPGSVLATGLSIKMALVSILGGIGTLIGPVLGAGVLTLIDELSRSTFGGTGNGLNLIIYGGLILVIAVFYPRGMVGSVTQWRRSRTSRSSNPSGGQS